MHPHLKHEKELEKRLLEKMSESELAEKIKEKQGEYADLLTRAGAIYILAKDRGLVDEDKKKEWKVSELQEGMRGVCLKAKVKQIFPSRDFDKNGRKGKVCRLHVEDEEGNDIALVLWNKDALLVEDGEIEKGDSIELHGGTVRNGELQTTDKGRIHVKKLLLPTKISELKERSAFDLVIARVLETYGVKEYEQKWDRAQESARAIDDSRFKKKKMCSALVGDETNIVRIVFWENSASEGAKLSPGDVVKLENGFFKNGEIHASNKTAVTINPKGKQPITRVKDLRVGMTAAIRGKIKSIEANDDVELVEAIVDDDGKTIECIFSRETALALLGVKELAEDIKLSTVCELKKEALLEKTVTLIGKTETNRGQLELLVEKTIRSV